MRLACPCYSERVEKEVHLITEKYTGNIHIHLLHTELESENISVIAI